MLLQLVMKSGDDSQRLPLRRSDSCLQGCQAWQHPCAIQQHHWVHHWSCPQGFPYPRQQLPFSMGRVTKGHCCHPTILTASFTRRMLSTPTTQRWRHLRSLQIMPQQSTRVGCLHVDIDSPSPPYPSGGEYLYSLRPKLYSSHRTTRTFACWQHFLPCLSPCAYGEAALLTLGSSFTCCHAKCFPTFPPLPVDTRYSSLNCLYSSQTLKESTCKLM